MTIVIIQLIITAVSIIVAITNIYKIRSLRKQMEILNVIDELNSSVLDLHTTELSKQSDEIASLVVDVHLRAKRVEEE